MAAGEAFQSLKTKMVTLPVLALPDFNKTFVIESDASGQGVGAVLMQEQRPIAYFSQAFNQEKRKKSVYERELMAIVLAIHKWKHYLMGRKFIVRTDQRSLKYLMEQREVNPEYLKWMVKLMGYQFEIQYRPGLENKAMDGLSRIFPATTVMALTIPRVLQLDKLQQEVAANMKLQEVVKEFKLIQHYSRISSW